MSLILAISDLMSLEPLDHRYRPLRTNETLWDYQKWAQMYTSEVKREKKENKDLRSSITQLIEKIDFKQIVRNIKGVWDRNDTGKNYQEGIFQHQKIPYELWKNYFHYLKNLYEKTSAIQEIYKNVTELLQHEYTARRIVIKDNRLKIRQDKYKLIKLIAKKYREAFMTSIDETNFSCNARGNLRMQNLWHVIGAKPFEASTDYFNPTNKNRPRMREFLNIIWKSYIINDREDSSYFTPMERLKIINWLVSNIGLNLGY